MGSGAGSGWTTLAGSIGSAASLWAGVALELVAVAGGLRRDGLKCRPLPRPRGCRVIGCVAFDSSPIYLANWSFTCLKANKEKPVGRWGI